MMCFWISFLYLILPLGLQETPYRVEVSKSNPEYFQVFLASDRDITEDIVPMSQGCFDEVGEELRRTKRELHTQLSSEEKTLIVEYGLYGRFTFGSSGRIEQIRFVAHREPAEILLLIGKIEQILRSEFHLEHAACQIQGGKFIRTNMNLKLPKGKF